MIRRMRERKRGKEWKERERITKNRVCLFLGRLWRSKLQGQRTLVQRLDKETVMPFLHQTWLMHLAAAMHCRWDRLTLASLERFYSHLPCHHDGSRMVQLIQVPHFSLVVKWSKGLFRWERRSKKLMLLLLATKREAILRTESTHKEKQNPETHTEKGGVLNGLYSKACPASGLFKYMSW